MRLFRISNILTLLIAAVFGFFLFWTSQDVQKKERELAKQKAALAQEQETIRVLSVEWDYLNRPQRLEELASEQLGMQLPSAEKVVTAIDQIPEPVIPAIIPMMDDQEGMVHEVSLQEGIEGTSKPVAKKPATISPSTAEKETFYQLIKKLNGDGGMEE